MFAKQAVVRSKPRLLPALVRFQSASTKPPQPSGLLLAATGVVVAATGGALGWYVAIRRPQKAPTKRTTSVPPRLDHKTGYPFQFLSPPSPEEVTRTLTQDTWSISKPVEGISRYDGSQLPHASTCEDRYIHGTFPSPSGPGQDWMAFGVYDGHLGSRTSEALAKHLVPYVHRFLSRVKGTLSDDDDRATHEAISSAFCSLDDAFVKQAEEIMESNLSWSEKAVRLGTGSNGSCALLSLYDPSSRKLHVACTGDSRAVLGRQAPDGAWEVVPLSIDQSGQNPAEKERVAAEHPDEKIDELVRDGRVLGLATARAFGDGHWKWPLATNERARDAYLADTVRAQKPELYRTPPYVTAKPEVATTVIDRTQPAFMIVATDGLWDALSSEQAVGLVGKWLAWRAEGMPDPASGAAPSEFSRFDYVRHRENEGRISPEKFTVCDENAAVHLTRNSLGGAHHDMVSGLLSFGPPYARYARDDITVQVVFFNCS